MSRSNRSRVLFLLVSAALVLPILAGTLLRAAEPRDTTPKDDSFYKYLSVFSEVLGLVRQSYVDEPDMGTLMSGALDGATDALDPFSLYVPANQVTAFEEAANVGSRRSGLTLLKEHGVAYVVAVEKGSPGAGAGLKVGDIVAKLDGRSTHLMPLWEADQILARPAGTHVGVEVIRQGEPVRLSFDLKPFAPPPPALEEVKGARLLRIPGFGPDTATAVRAILSRGAERSGRLLVDLRGVAAGDPEAAYAVGELFAQGPLGQLASRAGTVKTFASKAAPIWTGKVVVLVDRGTLGASEVLAAILHQKIGAELVGERTFGHAGRQGSLDLSSGRLLYTDAFYSGPDAKPIRQALKPDLLVDERARTYLEKDVPIDDLILDRGVHRLLGDEGETAKKAA
jgi:carboxyl-terminal processing protease